MARRNQGPAPPNAGEDGAFGEEFAGCAAFFVPKVLFVSVVVAVCAGLYLLFGADGPGVLLGVFFLLVIGVGIVAVIVKAVSLWRRRG